MKKKKFNIIVAGYIVVGIILCALVGNALAKYFQTSINPSTFKAMDFYFTSNLLDDGIHTLSPGATSVTFSLRNYADELKVSEMDVKIDNIMVTGPGTPTVSTVDDALLANVVDDLYVTISGLVPGKYTITAKAIGGRPSGASSGGYEKTIQGQIIVPEAEQFLYKYFQDYGSYVLLTVWSQGYKGNVSIDYPDGVIPDNTDSVMATALTGASFIDTKSFSEDKYASHTYRFFVSGSSVTESSFVVTYDTDSKIATYKDPK